MARNEGDMGSRHGYYPKRILIYEKELKETWAPGFSNLE